MKRTFLTACAIACAGAAQAAPVEWAVSAGGNGHFYDFVILDAAITAEEAETSAEGAGGYLATITSAAEQSFLNTIWTGPGSVTGQFNSWSYFLIGASDRASEGTFEWIGGSEEGDALSYTNWSGGEPNNFGTGEDYAVAWWQDNVGGLWNDVPGTVVRAYLVEFDGRVAPVPLPASGLLLVGGLAVLARRRR